MKSRKRGKIITLKKSQSVREVLPEKKAPPRHIRCSLYPSLSGEYKIYAGKYWDKPEGLIGICMAEEFGPVGVINCPTRDFSAPKKEVFDRALLGTIHLLLAGQPVYVGCAGGLGRTGLMLAALVKVGFEVHKLVLGRRPKISPVEYVRSKYSRKAVEVIDQELFVSNLDVTKAANVILATFVDDYKKDTPMYRRVLNALKR